MKSPELNPSDKPKTFAELLGEEAGDGTGEGRAASFGEILSTIQGYVDAEAPIPTNEVWNLYNMSAENMTPENQEALRRVAGKGSVLGDRKVADSYALLLEHLDTAKPAQV